MRVLKHGLKACIAILMIFAMLSNVFAQTDGQSQVTIPDTSNQNDATTADDTDTPSPNPEILNPPTLIFEPFSYTTVGQSVVAHIQLFNTDNRPIPNMPVIVEVDGERVRRARTNEDGVADIGLGNEFEVGSYDISVTFIGTEFYNPTSVQQQLVIEPITFTVQTIPPLPDIEFLFDNRVIKSDSEGLVIARVTEVGEYTLEPVIQDEVFIDEYTKAEFLRWSDSVFEPNRTVLLRRDKKVEAGYSVSHIVSQGFVDLEGNPVDDSRITSMTIKTSTGDRHTFTDGQPRWYQATRINRRREGLEATPILYSIEEVMIDGSNVINRYQQRFYIEPNGYWVIELLMYYADIRAFDVLFGFTVGDGVNVEYPSGDVVFFPYEEDNMVHIGPLARGTYKLEPTGVGGMASVTPVALSRYQFVELKVLTTLDIAVGLIAGLVGAFGMLFYGRPYLMFLPIDLLLAINIPKRISERLTWLPQPLRFGALTTGTANINITPLTVGPIMKKTSPSTKIKFVTVPKILLSTDTETYLYELANSCRITHIRSRFNIILMANKKIKTKEIVDETNYSRQSIRRYIRRYRKQGIVGLFNKPVGIEAIPSSTNYLEKLVEAVNTHPKKLGFSFPIWDAQLLSHYMVGQTNIFVEASDLQTYMGFVGWYGTKSNFDETEPVVTLLPTLGYEQYKFE